MKISMTLKKAVFIFPLCAFALFVLFYSCNSAPPPKGDEEIEGSGLDRPEGELDGELDALTVSVVPLTPADEIWALIQKNDINGAQSRFLALGDPEALDSSGRSFNHMASEVLNLPLADFFTRQSVPVDTKDNEGRTPLSIATDNMNAGLAHFFVQNGASIHDTTPQGNTTATKAVAQNNKAFLEAVLTRESLAASDSTGRTILHIASDQGSIFAVETITGAAGYDYIGQIVNKRDLAGKTALDIAYSHKESESHADCARAIIMGGGTSSDPFNNYYSPAIKSLNYNLRSANGTAPLHYAVQEGYSGYTRFLLKKGADANIKNSGSETPLHIAMTKGDIPAIRTLIDAGAKVDVQDANGKSPMHIAVPSGAHAEALAVLFAAGANPNLRDGDGNAPLSVFVKQNREPIIISTLLRGGSDVKSQNNEGKTALYIAVEEKRSALIPLLLDYDSDIFAVSSAGDTPFARALKDPGAPLPALITEKTVHSIDAEGNTPLVAATKSGAGASTIRLILDKGANINARNKEGESALHTAVRNNNAEQGVLLLERNADIFSPNIKGETPIFLTFFEKQGTQRPQKDIRAFMLNPNVTGARDSLGNTVLHYATQWKIDSVIPSIVSQGANTEAVNISGETPLFIAVKANAPSTVRSLLNAGASNSGRDALGNTALHIAVRANAVQAAEVLLDTNINKDAYNLYGQTPLHDAVRLKMYDSQALLVRKGASVEERDSEGNTALLLACNTGNFRAVEQLLGAGADITVRNANGDTSLHIAVRDERSDLVSLLLKNGAGIHSLNADNESPFTIALAFHDDRNTGAASRMVAILLSTERAKASDDEGRSPLHIAVLRNMSVAKMEIIAAQGGRVNSLDREGRTPLRLACDMDNWEAARFLVGAGSDVFSTARDGRSSAEIALGRGVVAIRAIFTGKTALSRDSGGNTILHYAARSGNRDLINLLLELGADRNVRNTAGESAKDIADRWGNTAAATLLG